MIPGPKQAPNVFEIVYYVNFFTKLNLLVPSNANSLNYVLFSSVFKYPHAQYTVKIVTK